MRVRSGLVWFGLAFVLSGCVSLTGENNPVRSEIEYTNETDFQIIRWVVPTRLSLDEFVAERGYPQIGSRAPGESWTETWTGQRPETVWPVCQSAVTHYFLRHRDPDFRLRLTVDDPKYEVDDLIVIETLEAPCWESDRATYTIRG